jgi:hypothetical protein
MQFDATDSLKALAALPPEPVKLTPEPKTSAWTAPLRAIPAAAAEVGAAVVKLGTAAPEGSSASGGRTEQIGQEVERSLRNVAESYAPDPETAGKAEQIIFGLTRGVGKAVGYGLTTGPAAPFLFGVDEGLTEREKLIRQGVDEATAGKVGAVTGLVNTAGFAIPVAGSTVARTFGLAALSGPASFVAQQSASRSILANADYDAIAQTYDPTDAWGLGLSMVPFGFGAWAMRSRMKGAKPGGTEPPPVTDKKSLPVDTAQPAITTSPADSGVTAASVPPVAGASGGIYTLSDAISADGPTSETIKLIVRDDGSAAIQRENGDIIDVTNMIRAGFSAERAIAQALGDDTSGANVAKIGDPSARPDVVPMEQGARAEEPPIPVEPVAETGVSPDIPARSPDVVPASPDVAPRVMPQEYVDAAMVQNLTDFADGVKANPPEKFEAELWRGAVTENPNFKAWFGESAIVQEDGAPLIVYHGTSADVPSFDPAQLQAEGIHLSTDPSVANTYAVSRAMDGGRGANVMPVYVSAAKVLDVPMVTTDVIREAFAAGYTAVRRGTHIVVARPEQIKSAIGNSGRFDPTSASLTDPIPVTAKEPAANVPPPQELGTQAREAQKPEGQAQGKAAEGQADPAVTQAHMSEVDRILAENPNLVVATAEDGSPITAAEAMAKIRRELAEGSDTELGTADAPLIKVAATCALSFGE